jgi:Spermine/spermidine synthase domain
METTSSIEMNVARRQLFILSVLALFAEMMLIRFVGTEILVFSYFKNMILMSVFLGLGLGFLKAGSQYDYFRWSGVSLLFIIGVHVLALPLGLTFLSYADPFQCMFWFSNDLHGSAQHFPLLATIKTLCIMMGIFSLNAFAFMGIGQQLGKRFEQMKPLEAYTINIAGSVIGTVLFAAVSYMQTSPGLWFALCGIMLLLFQQKPAHYALIVFGAVYSLWLAPHLAREAFGPGYLKTVWSPYFRVDVVESSWPAPNHTPVHIGYDLKVSYDTFQEMDDADRQELNRITPGLGDRLPAPNAAPYRIIPRVPRNVLILGAGNGADAQAAIDAGAQHVDAVDIDPAIADLGRTLHAKRPYLNPRVTLYNMDARTYLRNCKKKYDLIDFAYLDSHTAFSCVSSLRTDNYVFTAESYKRAAQLLDKDGLIFVSFVCLNDWLWNRHTRALSEATNMVPQGYTAGNALVPVGRLVAGPGMTSQPPLKLNWPAPLRTIDIHNTTELATDDWPFLFLPKREFSTTYYLPIILILLLSGLVVGRQLAGGHRQIHNWLMLLLGAGFMLLEVRGMMDLSLIFGSTWMVNTAVISAVFVFALLGNWLAARLESKHAPLTLLLTIITLSVLNMVHIAGLTSFGEWQVRLLGIILYFLPVAFSATSFSLLYKNSNSPATALSFNIFGGLIGCCLEYLSMLVGVSSLGWIAVGIYACALGLSLTLFRSELVPSKPSPALDSP